MGERSEWVYIGSSTVPKICIIWGHAYLTTSEGTLLKKYFKIYLFSPNGH